MPEKQNIPEGLREQLRAASRKGNSGLTPEQKRLNGLKGWEARKAKWEAEERKKQAAAQQQAQNNTLPK